jgi:quinol monooxygenase YgiN
MADNRISLILRVHLPADQRQQVTAAMQALVEPSRSEPGCIRYELYRDLGKDGELVLLECWRDQAAFDEHIAKPYLKDFTTRFADVFKNATTSGLTRLAAI